MRDAEGKFINIYKPPAPGVSYSCPCCGFKTLPERGGYDICQVCFWEDDGQDNHDADDIRGGPNYTLSLTGARRNFAAFGACEERFAASVRKPTDAERGNLNRPA
jgi:hypothetical protein